MLLHCCCAVCFLQVIDYLKENKKEDLVLFFSNSNIFPKQEYQKRLNELKKVAAFYKLEVFEDDYQHLNWLTYLKNNLEKPLNSYSENSERCLKCFEYRLKRVVEYAVKNKFSEFATTLSVNRFKDVNFINNFSLKLAKENNLTYVPLIIDPFKAYERGLVLSKKLNIYRQKYCGCEFSLKNKKL